MTTPEETMLREPIRWSQDRLELGEGARWVDDRLVLVDLLAGRLLETGGDAPGQLRELYRLDRPLGAVAPVTGRPGCWLAATGTGLALLAPGQAHPAIGLESTNAVP